MIGVIYGHISTRRRREKLAEYLKRGQSQIGARPEGRRRRVPRFSESMPPLIVMACRVISLTPWAWASTSSAASLSVSATATHPQEQDTAHGAVMKDWSHYAARMNG